MNTETLKPICDVQIRWMVRKFDLLPVLSIEEMSFEQAWTEEDFLIELRNRDSIGMVAERREQVVGFMIYHLEKGVLRVVNFAVAQEFRRQGVGSQMIRKLIEKLDSSRRDQIIVDTRESNLDAQCFFRSLGFECIETVHERYDDGQDAYRFSYLMGGQ